MLCCEAANLAAAYGGGLLIRQSLGSVELPQLHRLKDDGRTFKLSVRVVSASIPALQAPGVVSRSRPRLEVALDGTQKDTELADFAPDGAWRGGASPDPAVGALGQECPWRFGDVLTFVASVKDVVGPGLRLRLRAHSDITLGPVMLQMSHVADLGETAVDLRQRVLPSCVGCSVCRRLSKGNERLWESPPLLIPLSHVRGGARGANHGLGQAVAHVALAFSIDVDPEEILAAAEPRLLRGSSLGDALGNSMDTLGSSMKRWLFPDVGSWCTPRSDSRRSPMATPRFHEAPIDDREALTRAAARASRVKEIKDPLRPPELAPDNWVAHRDPKSGRVHWHHTALGPAPWEEEGGKSSLPSPDQAPDGWVSHRSSHGDRTFWHHTALGPAPWEQAPPPLPAPPPPPAGVRGSGPGCGAPQEPPARRPKPSPAPARPQPAQAESDEVEAEEDDEEERSVISTLAPASDGGSVSPATSSRRARYPEAGAAAASLLSRAAAAGRRLLDPTEAAAAGLGLGLLGLRFLGSEDEDEREQGDSDAGSCSEDSFSDSGSEACSAHSENDEASSVYSSVLYRF